MKLEQRSALPPASSPVPAWRHFCRVLIACVMLSTGMNAPAATPNQALEAVLARDEAPQGVVFEVVSSRENALERVLPDIKLYAERLKARFLPFGG